MSFTPDLIKKNVALKDFVTFKLGGPAEFFFQAENTDALVNAISYARSQGMPWFVLGGGSNLVVSDEGIDGLVVRNRTTDVVQIDLAQDRIRISSGAKLSDLVKLAAQNGLEGIEYLAGIPGSVGGAIYGNAGAYGRCIGDLLTEATVLFPDGTVRTVKNDFFKFDYRTSRLKSELFIVLSAVIQLQKGSSELIQATIDDIITQREGKHPPRTVGCAGSFFKNLPALPGESRRRAAGAVLEQAGAKLMSVGGASVFEKHANFIINCGKATASDVRALAKILKQKVKQQHNIDLHEEVLYIGR